MPSVMVRHKVADYTQWKRAVHSAADWRKASGEVNFQVFREADDPNNLTVISQWSTASKMRKFMDSDELRQRMEAAGVIGKPEVRFFSKSEDLTAG